MENRWTDFQKNLSAMFLSKEEMSKSKYANSGNSSVADYTILINKLIIVLIIKEYILYLETEEKIQR